MIKPMIAILILSTHVMSDSLYNNIDNDMLLDDISYLPLNSKYSVNKKFTNFEQVITTLNGLHINSKIISKEESEPVHIVIRSNTTIEAFINKASTSFGYKWAFVDGVALFTASYPSKTPNQTQASTTTPATVILPTWTLDSKSKTLRNAISTWCKKSNWQLIWNVRADYLITTSWTITGTFESAVNEVLKASQTTDMPLIATMHDSNHVLEITSVVTGK